MKLRKIALITVVLFSALSLFATEVSVTWEWEKNDADVAYFRYQLDNEAAEGWTVVPADVTSYTAEGLDGSLAYSLYLQQSYDGEYWSTSSVAVSKAVVPAKAQFVDSEVIDEEPAVVEEAVVDVPAVEEPAVVEEPAPLAPVEVVKQPSSFQFTTDLSAGLGFGLSSDVRKSVAVNLGLDFENIAVAGPVGFDIRTDLGFDAYNRLPWREYIRKPANIISSDNYDWSVHADLQLGMNVHAGAFMLYADGGARLVGNLLGYDSTNAFYSFGDKLALKWGVTADIGMRVNIGKVFGLGAEASYTYLFDKSKRHMFDARAFMSLTF